MTLCAAPHHDLNKHQVSVIVGSVSRKQNVSKIFKEAQLCYYLVDSNFETICAAPHHDLTVN